MWSLYLWMRDIVFNFYKLFLSLFANTVNFLETIAFFEGLQAEMKPAFRLGLLFSTSKAILSLGSY